MSMQDSSHNKNTCCQSVTQYWQSITCIMNKELHPSCTLCTSLYSSVPPSALRCSLMCSLVSEHPTPLCPYCAHLHTSLASPCAPILHPRVPPAPKNRRISWLLTKLQKFDNFWNFPNRVLQLVTSLSCSENVLKNKMGPCTTENGWLNSLILATSFTSEEQHKPTKWSLIALIPHSVIYFVMLASVLCSAL